MDKSIGCAPIYFCAALIFLLSGCFLVYFGHPVIGTILGTPGIILMTFSFYVWGKMDEIKRGEIPFVLKLEDEKDDRRPKLLKKKGRVKKKKSKRKPKRKK